MSASSVTYWDQLRPGHWMPLEQGPRWDPRCSQCHDEPQYLEDTITHQRYPNRSVEQMRDHCFVWTVAVPFVGSLVTVEHLIRKIVIIVTFSHFWSPTAPTVSLMDRSIEMGKDILRIITAPFALVVLECAAIYGIFSPYNGMKLFKTIQSWEDFPQFSIMFRSLLERGEAYWHSQRHLDQDVVIDDFCPLNDWTADSFPPSKLFGGGKCQTCRQEPRQITDQHREYFNDNEMDIRIKGVALAIGTPFIHPIAIVHNVAYRLLRTITLSRLWVEKEGETSYELRARLQDVGSDLLKIVAAPIALVGLELAALYAIVSPRDGKKLYATIERAEYGGFILAPCFQPGYDVYHSHPH